MYNRAGLKQIALTIQPLARPGSHVRRVNVSKMSPHAQLERVETPAQRDRTMNKTIFYKPSSMTTAEALQKRVRQLEKSLARQLATPKMIRGWSAICDYTGIPQRTLERYVTLYGFPAVRVGAKSGTAVVSSPAAIDAWFLARRRQQSTRKPGSTYRAEYFRQHPRESALT